MNDQATIDPFQQCLTLAGTNDLDTTKTYRQEPVSSRYNLRQSNHTPIAPSPEDVYGLNSIQPKKGLDSVLGLKKPSLSQFSKTHFRSKSVNEEKLTILEKVNRNSFNKHFKHNKLLSECKKDQALITANMERCHKDVCGMIDKRLNLSQSDFLRKSQRRVQHKAKLQLQRIQLVSKSLREKIHKST